MVFGVAVVAAGIGPQRRPRSGNIRRVACESNEDPFLSCRLSDQQIDVLACEFAQWRLVNGVTTGSYYANRKVKLFVQYLARGGYYHQVGRAEGLSLTATATYLHQVAEFFTSIASQ